MVTFYREENLYSTPIGEIPKDWKVQKVEDLFVVETGTTPPTKEREFWEGGTINWITPTDLSKLKGKLRIGNSERKITEKALEEVNLTLMSKGSLILSTRAPVGYVSVLDEEATFNQGCKGLVPKNSEEIVPEFYCYYLSNKKQRLQNLSGGSTFKELSKKRLEKFTIPYLPIEEQRAIVGVLGVVDSAVELVDKVIWKTERLKKGLMQTLLTRGIGHKEYKQTPIGKIPKDWSVVKIKDVAEVKGGKRVPKGQKFADYKTPHPYIRVVDFKNMTVDTANLKYLPPRIYSSIKRYTISSDDVYISIAGTIGLAGLVPKELDGANLTENAAKLCNLRGVAKEFLAYVLNSGVTKGQIAAYVGKAQQPKLALFRIKKIRIPLPPPPEQRKIAGILSTIDKKLELEMKEKSRLERIKQGLMDLFLTGKIRVKVD
jgi:type I restriction enzyme S subunit